MIYLKIFLSSSSLCSLRLSVLSVSMSSKSLLYFIRFIIVS
jgi:hypothetical protein